MNKEDFIAAASIHGVKEIDVPKLGAVFIREISAGERDKIETVVAQFNRNPDTVSQYRARMVAMFLCDENAKRLFSDKELAQLDGMNAEIIDYIFERGLEFNGFKDDTIDDAEKN